MLPRQAVRRLLVPLTPRARATSPLCTAIRIVGIHRSEGVGAASGPIDAVEQADQAAVVGARTTPSRGNPILDSRQLVQWRVNDSYEGAQEDRDGVPHLRGQLPDLGDKGVCVDLPPRHVVNAGDGHQLRGEAWSSASCSEW